MLGSGETVLSKPMTTAGEAAASTGGEGATIPFGQVGNVKPQVVTDGGEVVTQPAWFSDAPSESMELEKDEVGFGDNPGNEPQKCKPGIPQNTINEKKIIYNAVGKPELIVRQLRFANGKIIGNYTIGPVHFPDKSFFYIGKSLYTFPGFEGQGIATEMANLLLKDWIEAMSGYPNELAITKVVTIYLNKPKLKGTCYAVDKQWNGDVLDWDGETRFPTHWLMPH
jgi:hypothetical protein